MAMLADPDGVPRYVCGAQRMSAALRSALSTRAMFAGTRSRPRMTSRHSRSTRRASVGRQPARCRGTSFASGLTAQVLHHAEFVEGGRFLQFGVIAHAMTQEGQARIERHPCKPLTSYVQPCPTVFSAFNKANANACARLCQRYDPVGLDAQAARLRAAGSGLRHGAGQSETRAASRRPGEHCFAGGCESCSRRTSPIGSVVPPNPLEEPPMTATRTPGCSRRSIERRNQ